MLNLEAAYFIVASLLVLSIITIGLCRRDKHVPTSYSEFLFKGKSFFHSVVSSAGAVFSVTYLLGATFIYATIYRAWTFLMAGAVAIFAFLIIRRIIHLAAREFPLDPSSAGRHNILIRLMKYRLGKNNFQTFNTLLAISFFLLLVEELAISRVVLSSVMRGLEPLAPILLFVIVAVVFAYLYIGGFRAVLNSDLIQGAVLIAFLSVLAYYVSRQRGSLGTLARPPDIAPMNLIAATILWTAYGGSFLVMAVDLFSRLNFDAPVHLLTRMRVRFVGVSLLIVFLIVTSGIGFGLAISNDIGILQSASGYYSTIVTFFVAADFAAIQVVFLIGLFCMIFTTVDTLALAFMQIGFYGRGFGSRRVDLPLVLLLAVGASVLVDVDAVCAFGIFVGAVLLLPCTQVLGQLFVTIPFTPATSHRYLWFALTIAALLVVWFRALFIEDFEIHYAIPGIVLLSTASCGVVAAAWERLMRRSFREN